MAPDLHLAPDAVDDLSRLARRIADGLAGAAPPNPPGPPGTEDVTDLLDVPVRRAAAELAAFAERARTAAGRVRDADRAAAAALDPAYGVR